MTEQLKPETETTTSPEEPEYVDISAYEDDMKSFNEGRSPAELEEAKQREARYIEKIRAESTGIRFDLEYQLLEDPRPRRWRGVAWSTGEYPAEAIQNFAVDYSPSMGTVIAIRVVMPDTEEEEEEVCRRHGFTRSFTK